jgi:hypothetical protein
MAYIATPVIKCADIRAEVWLCVRSFDMELCEWSALAGDIGGFGKIRSPQYQVMHISCTLSVATSAHILK